MSKQFSWICGGERRLYASSKGELFWEPVRDDLCDVSASRRGGPGPHTCAEQSSRPVQWTRARRGPLSQGIQRSWGTASLAWARLVSWVAGCWKENKRNRKRPQALLCVQDTWTGAPRPPFEEIRRARAPTKILRSLRKAHWVRRADFTRRSRPEPRGGEAPRLAQQRSLPVRESWMGSSRPPFEVVRRVRAPAKILRCLRKAHWVRRADYRHIGNGWPGMGAWSRP
jgi:hypothetical protein